MTQNDMVLNYIKQHGSITQQDAYLELGCTRLPSRIWDLKQLGHKFRRTMETGCNRFGEKVTYARYVLV